MEAVKTDCLTQLCGYRDSLVRPLVHAYQMYVIVSLFYYSLNVFIVSLVWSNFWLNSWAPPPPLFPPQCPEGPGNGGVVLDFDIVFPSGFSFHSF